MFTFKIMKFKFIILIGIILFVPNGVSAQDPVIYISPGRVEMDFDGDILKTPYEANRDLEESYDEVDRAVVTIHGGGRYAISIYWSILAAAELADHAEETTFIIAPQFLAEMDIEANGDTLDVDSLLYWSINGWKKGNLSLDTEENPRPAVISSFAVVDTILYRLAQNNPNLEKIVVSGFSAGGQFVNRYAAGNQMEPIIQQEFGIDIRYVIGSPSSYMYFDETRRVEGTLDEFEIPSDEVIEDCPYYNEYHYGLEDLNSYMESVGEEQIMAQYESREVIYLLGEEDDDPNHPGLDTGCSAMLQGDHRLERGIIYFNHLYEIFGYSIFWHHEQAIIPGVAHDANAMFTSDCGLYYLFDYGECDHVVSVDPPQRKELPLTMNLPKNYPNPFNPSTTIRFGIPNTSKISESSEVYLQIYDITGKLITTLIDGTIEPGYHSIVWDGKDKLGKSVESGIYIYKLQVDGFMETGKMTLLR